jgi:hypothetical protein
MPATNFPEYARKIQDVLDTCVAAGEAVLVSIQVDQRSSLRGFIAGLLQFSDASELHFREFVDTSLPEPKLMYAYHYQDANKALVFRYDNAAHTPPLPQAEHKHDNAAHTPPLPQAEHKHAPSGTEIFPPPTLAQVVDEILS